MRAPSAKTIRKSIGHPGSIWSVWMAKRSLKRLGSFTTSQLRFDRGVKLYGYRNGRTFRASWALQEVGAQYEYVEVDLMRGEGREPWFLEINPAGKVPVLDDGGTI